MINRHLSKQGICWPVSCDHIVGSSLQLIKVNRFFEVVRWRSAGFQLCRGLMSSLPVENRAGLFGKLVNAHPGLNVNQIKTFSSMQMFLLLFLCIYMLFADWEVRIVKNCERGLETRGHSFSLYGPTLSGQITSLFISCYKLAYKWVYATLSLNWSGLSAVYERSYKLHLTTEHVLKNWFISTTLWKLHLVHRLSAPKLFSDVKFRAKFEVALQK